MAVKICAGCGEANKENSRICIVCSNSLNNAHLEGTLNSEKKYERSWLSEKKSILIAINVMRKLKPMLIVGGIFSFNDDPSKQEIGVKLLIFGLAIIGLQIFLAVVLI